MSIAVYNISNPLEVPHRGFSNKKIWYRSDEPFSYNHIKHKEMSNESGSVTQQGHLSQKRLLDLYEAWKRVKLPLHQQSSV